MEISFKTNNIHHTCIMYVNEHINIYQKSTDNEEGICIWGRVKYTFHLP